MAGHVERPQRTAVLVERLKETGLSERCWHVPARQVDSMLTPVSPPPTTVSWRTARYGLEICIRVPTIQDVRAWEVLGIHSGDSSPHPMLCAVWVQATDEELQRAHTAEHVRHVSGPPKDDEWLMGDNFYSELTPIAARYAAGCSVQVSLPRPGRTMSIPGHITAVAARGQSLDAQVQGIPPSIS